VEERGRWLVWAWWSSLLVSLRVERLVDTLQADVNGAVAILNALLHVRGLDGIHCGLFHLIHPKGGEAYSPM
jgi:hypothetical protein